MSFIHKIKTHASEDRIEKLIEERLKPNANKQEIDQRIWDLFGEEWAIMFTDMSGFSRNVAEFGIIHFLQIIHESKKILIPKIDNFDGILLKMEGDSMLIIFRNPKKAVECAIAMQKSCKEYNISMPDTEKILLCIGIGFGKVLRIGDDDVFGSEVNAASKLGEDTAKAWEIMLTDSAKKALEESKFRFEKLDSSPSGANAAFKLNYSV